MASEPKVLTKAMSAEEALRLMAQSCADDFALFLDLLNSSDDPAGPHGARVALRRFRSVLFGFAPLISPKAVAPLQQRTKTLFRRIGLLRDADVLAHDLGDLADKAALLASAHALRQTVRAELQAAQADGFSGDIARFFAGSDWRRKGRNARHWREGAVKALAAEALGKVWKRCRDHGRDLAEMSDADRHELRKDLKTFRYLSEFFAPLWPGTAMMLALQELRMMQDKLGELNDIATAKAKGVVLPKPGGRKDRAAEALRLADEAWHRMGKTRPWW